MPARQRETQPAFFDGEASDQRNAARAIFKSVTVAALADIYAVHTRGYYAATRPNEAEFLQLVTPMTGLDRSTDRLTPAGRTSRDATVRRSFVVGFSDLGPSRPHAWPTSYF